MLGTRTLRDRSTSRDPDANQQTTQVKAEVKEKTKEKPASGQWVEPSLAQKPSYKDHQGVSYYGVSEHMQPLGEAPSARVKARVRPDGGRKSLLVRGVAAGGVDAQETPEGTPAPPAAAPIEKEPVSQPRIVVEDEDDGDYASASKGKKKERAARQRPAKRTSTAAHTPSVPKTTVPESTVNQNRVYDQWKMYNVVQSAKDRATQAGKMDLAYAVEEIYQSSLTDARLTALLEQILLQTATPEQTREFHGYVRAAKKKIKEQGGSRFTAAEMKAAPSIFAESTKGANSLPHRSPSKSTTQPPQPATIAVPSTERSEASKPKISLKAKSPKTSDHRRPHKSGSMSASPSKKRSGSVDSDSSLTDLTSNPDDDNEMDVEDTAAKKNGVAATSAAMNGTKAKDHAAERGNLAAPNRPPKRSSADADLAEDERERTIALKKSKLSLTVNRDEPHEESNMRGATNASPARIRSLRNKNGPALSLATNGISSGGQRGDRATSTDLESPLSDMTSLSSEQSPPHVYKGPGKAFGKKAKTKQSPEKKHLSASSGMAGASGAGRDSPIGDDHNEELSENNDFCSACGGSGFLLCCDGCDRSFHFTCLDPPLNEDASELNEPWYCYICVAKRPVTSDSPEKPQRGLFAPLFTSLKKRNPSNFALPQDVRDYFEGVATDRNGAFIEAVHNKPRTRLGYDEAPDLTKTKDNKGNTILCYCCGKSSQGTRPIIQCDYCGENWHLDCLDPPLANPPARNLEGRKLHDWMCPLHADHELRRLDTSVLNRRSVGRKIHLRKPRNAKVVEPAMRRGTRNNGLIEVVDDDPDDSGSEFYDEESQDENVVVRLPVSGIRLDFIDKVKQTRVQQLRSERAYKRAQNISNAPRQLAQANFARRSFTEKQIALNLAQFASGNQDLNLGTDQVENLVGTLIAEAPPEVVNEMMAAEEHERARSASSAIPPSPPASEQTDQLSAQQRKELQMLQELIRRRLESSKT